MFNATIPQSQQSVSLSAIDARHAILQSLQSKYPHAIDVRQLAEILGYSYFTMRNFLREGKIPLRNIGIAGHARFALVEVANYLTTGQAAPQPVKAGRGRPLGSKNKPKNNSSEVNGREV